MAALSLSFRMIPRWNCLLAVLCSFVSVLSNPYEIIDATGRMKQVDDMRQWIGKRIKGPGDRNVVVIGSAGSRGSGKSSLLNGMFSTDFGMGRTNLGSKVKARKGIVLCQAEGGQLLCVDYDAVGTGTEGSATNGRSLALQTRLADAIILSIRSSDIGRSVSYNTLALQAILQEQLQAEGSPKTLLVVAVHDHEPGGDDGKTRDALLSDLQAIWTTIPKSEDKADADLNEFFDLGIFFLPHPTYRAEEYAAGLQDLKQRFADLDLLSSRYSKHIERDTLAATLSEYWTEIKGRNFIVLPSRIELLATFQIETQYSQALRTVDSRLGVWKAAVDRGRVIGNFGEAATALYSSILAQYDRMTQSFAASPLRVRKHNELRAALSRGIVELTKKQLSNLQNRGLKKFKAGITKYVGREDREDLEVELQKQLEEEYQESASKVIVSTVSGAGSYEKALDDYINQLTEYSQRWPSSPAYNVQAMKRLEKGSKRKKGGKISWAPNFQLVSLLRIPGDGSFQGFGSYQAGPVNFLFGAQNDRNLPESRVEGQLPAWLKLQPKVTFDVDL